jgi:branched-chain amino acid aminotransferase
VNVGVAQTRVWVNGEPHAEEAAHLSSRDRGVTLADGVFETMRSRDGRIFRLERHLTRLDRALRVLEIPAPAQLRDWVIGAATEVGGGDGSEVAIRLTVTRGVGPQGLMPPSPPRPTVIVSAGPIPSFPSPIYTTGLHAHVASGRRNEYSITAGLKTLAYVESVAALLEARRAGADEALLLDTAGHCSEAAASNLFAWLDTTLVTPPLSCAALPGITREAVIELARAEGIAVAERPFGPDELLAASESFLTSSLRGIAPLVRIGDRLIGRGVPGELTRRLGAAHLALIARECGRRS